MIYTYEIASIENWRNYDGKRFYSAIEDRRSIYAISKEQVVSDEKIQK